MTTEKQNYIHCDENGNITILSEDDSPKCPKTNDISPRIIIIGNAKPTPEVEHINCRCCFNIKGGDGV